MLLNYDWLLAWTLVPGSVAALGLIVALAGRARVAAAKPAATAANTAPPISGA
jgi:hypothetical protein